MKVKIAILFFQFIAVENAQKILYANYKNMQLIRSEHDWPPYHFKYFTPLSIIYENVHTEPGSTENTPGNCLTTEDIKNLFSAYRGCQSYKILIEGEPGIGKTILSSEIATQWADKAILDDKALLFLLFMRQPETKNISSVRSLVEHFFHDDMSLVTEITEWLINTNGKHLTILLDGYDEASTYSDFFDFVSEIISHQRLPECGLVITSRPAESLHLHGRVNCRAEVLGFTKQSREDFIKSYITKQEKEKQIYQTNKQDIIEHNIKKKIKIIEKVLKQNPIMNTLCYIPLNATMLLLCLTESEEETDLPTTVTTLCERFIILTIKHFLRTKPGIADTILGIDNLPGEYKQTFVQLSKFAYSASIDIGGKKSMQLVFELADIESNCEKFVSHGNGLGLLKPASFLNIDIQKKYASYNFLHKSIQEYMAAYHIASLPSGSATLSNLLNKRFWDSSYFNIWIMYVGITGGEDKEFKHFLSGSHFKLFTPNPSKISDRILGDKIKCLYLLRCAAEAQESRFLLSVQNIFEEKVIDLSNKALSEVDMKTLGVLLLDLPDGPWSLNLSGCNINNKCCKVLFETFTSQTVTSDIKTIDISFNNISSENLSRLCHEVCEYWKTKEIILPIDALYNTVTMKEIKHLNDTLQSTTQLSSGKLMILYQANQTRIICVYSDLKYVKCFQLSDCELNEDVAKGIVTEKLKNHRIGQIYFSYSIDNHHDIKIILSYIVENFQEIKFCGFNMHSKGAYLLDNTSSVDFQIENDPLTCLVDFLAAVLQNDAKVNASSSYLPMLSKKVKEKTKETIENISTLKVLDLTSNGISGNVMDDIEFILICNNLEELHLGRNNLQEAGMIKIAEALQSNLTLKIFDISNNNIKDKAVNSIAGALANKTKLEKLYLNGNNLDISIILSKLQNSTNSLKILDVSQNAIYSEAADDIAHFLSKQIKLEQLILGGNNLQDGLLVIIRQLKCYPTLKVLDISSNSASMKTIDCIAILLRFQAKLDKLCLGGNNFVNAKTIQTLQYFLPLTTFDISCNDEVRDDTLGAVSRPVVYIQILLLAYNIVDFLPDKSDDNVEHEVDDSSSDTCKCRMPPLTVGMSLKHDVAKLSGVF